jgi:hypothetical protein
MFHNLRVDVLVWLTGGLSLRRLSFVGRHKIHQSQDLLAMQMNTSRFAYLRHLTLGALCSLSLMLPNLSSAQESTQIIGGEGFFSLKLVTTIFKPEGVGPFPIVVINHGWSLIDLPSEQWEFRPTMVAAEFLRRNYAVVIPNRRGFAGSSGGAVGYDRNCNLSGF